MIDKRITELTECRVCGEPIEESDVVLDLGSIYPSAFLSDDEKLSEDSKAPLVLCKCSKCGLVQLRHTIDLDLMYRQYWYSSSLNKSMVSSLRDVVIDIESKVNITSNDVVVDIGCNDGTMLGMFPRSCKKVGFDPALNLTVGDYEFINDYFSAEKYNVDILGKAKVITAIAMFYDLPNPVKFAKDVASILDDDGVFVIQFTDLLSMFKVIAFDNICHEHLEYYRLVDVVTILNEAGLRVCDVSYNDVNGASIRVTAVHRDSSIETKEEVIAGLVGEFNYFKDHGFEYFSEGVRNCKRKVSGFLKWCKSHNHSVHLLGASTKGNTFLQVCGITSDDIKFAAEVNKDKFGLRTAGSDIKIISEEDSLIMHPSHYIVPVWHFKESILKSKRIQDYLKSNGSLVFPLPEFIVVTQNGEWRL